MGIEFSGIVTVGNSIDIGPADLVEHYFHDPETRVVGVYVEDVKDGRRFFDCTPGKSRAKTGCASGRRPYGRGPSSGELAYGKRWRATPGRVDHRRAGRA